jgi:hypothetical protein
MKEIKFLIVVSNALLGSDLVYHQIANGQENKYYTLRGYMLGNNTDYIISLCNNPEILKQQFNATIEDCKDILQDINQTSAKNDQENNSKLKPDCFTIGQKSRCLLK